MEPRPGGIPGGPEKAGGTDTRKQVKNLLYNNKDSIMTKLSRSIIIVPLLVLSLIAVCWVTKDELVLGSKGKTDYQVVLPEQGNVDLDRAAKLIRDAFAANGMDLPVVTEGKMDGSKPGIYLGDTRLARSKGIEPSQFGSRSYLIRTIGKDLVIAGPDEDPMVGVVKGVCDFLHEYAGTRFLYPGETGTEFLNTPVISLPSDLDLLKEFTLKFNYSGDMYPEEQLYNIANNHWPQMYDFSGAHMWEAAIPLEEYYPEHPEYFALIDGRRLDQVPRSQYCISNPDVMDLIVKHMVHMADEGRETVVLGQPDGFRKCQCEKCYDFYGTGNDWDEKVWLFHYNIAERFNRQRPQIMIAMLAYQATTHPPKTIIEFPENTILYLSHAHDEALDEWSESSVKVPGGIMLEPRMLGTHYIIPYLPKRTPQWFERRVRKYHEIELDVIGLKPFVAAQVYGLEAPAWYVFGRMFDDPKNNTAGDLLEEFYTAAFGEAVDPMRRFYGILHENISFMSDWFFPRSASRFYMGLTNKPDEVDDQLNWARVSTARFGARGMNRGIPDAGKGLILNYPSDMLIRMEKELKAAEALAGGDKVIKRLELVRLEFEYLKQAIMVYTMYNAYKTNPEQASLDRLLGGIDAWNTFLDALYDEEKRMKSLSGWPEMRPFRNRNRSNLAMITARRWRDKPVEINPFAWDTEKIRSTGKIAP
jgi:hypothetical protein